MKARKSATILFGLVLVSLNILAEAATSPTATSPTATSPSPGVPESGKTKCDTCTLVNEWFIYLVISVILIGGFVALNRIMLVLSKSEWSFADALSEEASITSLENDGNGCFKPRLGADGKPIMITELRASSSRMIALVGMVLILLMFLGFGVFSMYFFAKTGVMPNPEYIVNFLAAGMTLFAPYLVNQFSALFEKLTPKKS